MTVVLVALQDFMFDDREVVRGEVFAVAPIQAAAFTYQHKARFAPTDVPDLPIPPDAPRRGRYSRTDLRAED